MKNLSLKLSENVGNEVSLVGTISNNPWQHLIDYNEEYSNIGYFDLEDGNQIVIYSKEMIKCEKRVKIKGKVIEISGKSKRPGDTSKEVYREYQIIVEDWECFN
jgi:hypothetical protein